MKIFCRGGKHIQPVQIPACSTLADSLLAQVEKIQ
jgi:hypothetical protein